MWPHQATSEVPPIWEINPSSHFFWFRNSPDARSRPCLKLFLIVQDEELKFGNYDDFFFLPKSVFQTCLRTLHSHRCCSFLFVLICSVYVCGAKVQILTFMDCLINQLLNGSQAYTFPLSTIDHQCNSVKYGTVSLLCLLLHRADVVVTMVTTYSFSLFCLLTLKCTG